MVYREGVRKAEAVLLRGRSWIVPDRDDLSATAVEVGLEIGADWRTDRDEGKPDEN